MGIDYDETTDLWSYACMVFELITGDFLFNPRPGDNHKKNDDHLALFMEMLGPMPKKMAMQGNMFEHYTSVCNVAVDGGLVADAEPWQVRDLEDVFAVLNGRYMDEDTGEDLVFDAHVSGYTTRTFLNKTTKESRTVRNMHSLSVGDIVFDSVSDTYNMVDGMGFSDITAQILSSQPGV